MPAHATRQIRNTAVLLMLASGVTHVAQLWFRDTDPAALLTALVGMYYLVLALGLAGRARFTVWITAASLLGEAAFGLSLWSADAPDMLMAWHILAGVTVAGLCLYVLYRTRYSPMD
jgi:hypothetical protein